MKTQKQLTWFTASYSQIAVIFPILVAAPRFFRGSIDLGTLMQIALAFGQVQNSLSWFIHSYSGLADWKASVDRLLNFDDRLDQLKTEMAAQQNIHVFQDKENTGVKINLKQLLIPSGEALLENIQLEFFQGEHLLITGPSGCGKSTLFRALAGIWPFGQGEVKTPRGKILFLPQKPYLPIGSLKEALSYPSTLKDFSDAELKEALGLCSLNYLTEKMAIKENWAQQLSPGEQQRLAFARAILHRPDWLFMDESTSSVDPELEKNLYETLQKKLPDCTLVSIAHRPNVAHYHSKRLRFVKDAELSKLVVESI